MIQANFNSPIHMAAWEETIYVNDIKLNKKLIQFVMFVFNLIFHSSSSRCDVQDKSEDNSSSVANPKPCHRILPNLSSKKMYLLKENVNHLFYLNDHVRENQEGCNRRKMERSHTLFEGLIFWALSWNSNGHQMNKQFVSAVHHHYLWG